MSSPNSGANATITLPLVKGWYEGSEVYYVTTDISEPKMAKAMNANYVPRLANAVPPNPKPPQLRTVVERIYRFPNGEQANVLPSIPFPLGPDSTDTQYSPLWLLYEVTWKDSARQRLLTSEEAVLAAADSGLVDIYRTTVIVNCPVVKLAKTGASLGVENVQDIDATEKKW
ncbi:MAG: hypothetical protein MI864_23825 [Pseudomonadales bacterium]|nr:hypothetical protein [Pseudomonadales bacterium]